MECIVLAGGFGTRLSMIVKDVPKPMALVSGRPFLEYILDDIIDSGIKRIILAVCYKKESIIEHFGNKYKNTEILYSVEKTPLYTGGAIKKSLNLCYERDLFVINGDTYFKVNLEQMKILKQKSNTDVVIAVKEMKNFSRYGKVDINKENIITEFHEKKKFDCGYINGGIYLLDRDILKGYPDKFSIEDDCFPNLLEKRKVSAFKSSGYFIDIGVPEDFYKAQSYFKYR